jgi:hypothetical protein
VARNKGRPLKFGGGYNIQHAHELFRASEAQGNPDYTSVALAIGASPANPPPWAILACIEAIQAAEQSAARGRARDMPPILDDLVRYFAYRQWEFERSDQAPGEQWNDYRPHSFRSAVIAVARKNPKWSREVNEGNDDWFKPIRRAWDWEQEHDQLASSVWRLDGFKTTWRIDRVMRETVAAEEGDPIDLQQWVWLAKRHIDSM